MSTFRYDIELNSAAHYPPREVIELASAIEAAGFDACWKGESNSIDPLTLLGGIAVRTRTLRVGTAIAHIHARSPVSLGIAAATLQEISDGRLLLGIGVGNQTIAAWHGSTFDRPLARARDYLDIVKKTASASALDGDRSGFRLAWKPSYPDIRTYLAALGPKMSALAGEIADGVLVNMAPAAKLREIGELAREGALRAGRDRGAVEVVTKVRVCLHEDRARARAALRRVVAFYTVADHYRQMLSSAGLEADVETVRSAFAAGGLSAAAKAVSDSYMDSLPTLAATSIEELVERVGAYRESGAQRVIFTYVPASPNIVQETRDFVEAWGKHPG